MSNYIIQYENKMCVYIYGAISKTVNWIMYLYVMLFIAGFSILNTSLTIMVRGIWNIKLINNYLHGHQHWNLVYHLIYNHITLIV